MTSILPFKRSKGFQSNSPGSGSGKQIWALGGGKGGIGKTFISSSIGITLAHKGYSVILIDLDLGAANLHTSLGAPIPRLSLSDYLSGRVPHLENILQDSGVHNLKFISGANDSLNVANLKGKPKENLIKSIYSLPAQYIILDLGAGTTENTLDFFVMADRSILTVTPEPTSIENGYRFIKSAFYRKLKLAEKSAGVQSIIDEAMDHKNSIGIKSPADLIKHVNKTNPAMGREFQSRMNEFQLNVIMNQIRTRQDIEVGYAVQSVCRKYFGIDSYFIGYLDFDNAVWQSVRKKRPLITEFPYSSVVTQFLKIVDNLVRPLDKVAVL
jgi:flagellar biosynthesis protein FlhG